MRNFTKNLAIAIGINNYRNNIAELKTARPDAEKLVDLLATDYNYQVELIIDNTPRKPTLSELKTLLTEWLPQQLQPPAHNDFLSDKRGTSEKDDKHSPFAEALFEALQDGKPDEKGNCYKKADLTKDGVITTPELYLYLRDNVETRSGERQTPGLFPLKRHGRGEYIFHDPNFDPTSLSEAPELDEANNPYRGLKPFEEQHARFFFGRQELIKQLYARIAAPDRSLTVVVAGK